MVLTVLGRATARCGVLGRIGQPARAQAATRSSLGLTTRSLSTSRQLLGDYDWNMGVPGSRLRNPDPSAYDDVAPSMGLGWWTLIVSSVSCFFWGNSYDHSRGITVATGIFGPNMPI
mmetsp:Transcript_3196/g.7406  ORF Transcript_3196/g.7406 Transcript_3196/m.7406 type:complete len:117 (+) Transcript_3196:89-439(+)